LAHFSNKEKFIKKATKIHGNKYDYSRFVYVNFETPGTIICGMHGEFLQSARSHIHREAGCQKCAHEAIALARTYPFKKWIKLARKIFGNKYDYSKFVHTNSVNKSIIICPIHGEFLRSLGQHIHGRIGCPSCNIKYKNEDYCKRLLEQLFGESFPKCRPNFLKYQNGRNLELDGFNSKRNLAFEYQGKQHYEYIPHFHRNGSTDLTKQQERDRFKKEKCLELWIPLIIIPYQMNDKTKIDNFMIVALRRASYHFELNHITTFY